MNTNNEPLKSDMIRQLLDRYYSGETSTVENAAIREYFRNIRREDVDEDLLDDYEIFSLEDAAADEMRMPESLEKRLSDMIDAFPEDESEIGLSATSAIGSAEHIRKNSVFGNIWKGVAVAASLLAFFVAAWMFSDSIDESVGRHKGLARVEKTTLPVSSGIPAESTVVERNNVANRDENTGNEGADPATRVIAKASVRNTTVVKSTEDLPEPEYDGIDDGEEAVEISERPEDDGYIVITDPDEAVAIARMALAELGSRLGKMNETVQEADGFMNLKQLDRSLNRNIISEKLNKFVEYEEF